MAVFFNLGHVSELIMDRSFCHDHRQHHPVVNHNDQSNVRGCCGLRSLTACRGEAAPYSGDMAANTSVSFARWRQGEQTVTGVHVVF